MSGISVTVFHRSDRTPYWQAQYVDPLTGKKVVKSTRRTRQRDAERFAAQWQVEVEKDLGRPTGNISWEDFRWRYEEEHLRGLARKTETKAVGVLNVFEREMRPGQLRDVSADMLVRYQRKLRDAGRSENTIKSHMTHIRAAMAWAHDIELIGTIPKVRRVQRAKASTGRKMKGRAITTEEFERMLTAAEKVIRLPANRRDKHPSPDWDRIPSWQRYIEGLWWSGLRLAESLQLHWTDTTRLCVDLTDRYAMLSIPAELEKGNKDRLLPLAPEFAEFLLRTPERDRTGFVFDPEPQRYRNDRLGEQQVGRTVGRIGKAAQVKVDERNGRPVYASAHDLRRSFGERWASKLMPKRADGTDAAREHRNHHAVLRG